MRNLTSHGLSDLGNGFSRKIILFLNQEKRQRKSERWQCQPIIFLYGTQFWHEKNVFLIFVPFPRSTKFYPKHVKLLQSCPTLCDHMHHSLPGSSAHGILQARILEWVAVPSSRGSSCSRIEFVSLLFPSLTSRFFTSSTTWEAHPKVQQTANESNQLSAQQTASKSNQLSALRKIRYYSYLLIFSVLCLFSLGLEKVKVSEVAQSCLTLCDPVDCSLPGSSVHGIFQARILEWVAISFSRGPSWPRDQTWDSRIAGRRFTLWTTREAQSFRNKQSFKFST